MRTIVTGGLLAAVVGTALSVVSVAPASAQLARPQTALDVAGDNSLLTDVQWRRGGGAWRGGGWRGGYGWRGGGWRGYGWRGYGYRPWVGAGVGLATGLAIGSALASPYYYGSPEVYYEAAPVYRAPGVGGDAVAYCMQRFKSYDPSSGTYLGYDGRRHPCP